MLRRQRLWAAAACGGTLALGALYRFPPERFPVYPPCPFHLATGLLCPGCGATRALAALLHGNLLRAFAFNQLFVVLLALLAGWGLLQGLRAMRGQAARWRRPSPAMTATLLAVAVLFTVWRNLQPLW